MNEEIKWPKITKDMPLPELKRIHQMIWDYAIKYGRKPKTPYFNECAACAYAWAYYRTCSGCPIIWPKNEDGICFCASKNGPYSRWLDAKGEEKTALAKQIRDLPWKYELEENAPL